MQVLWTYPLRPYKLKLNVHCAQEKPGPEGCIFTLCDRITGDFKLAVSQEQPFSCGGMKQETGKGVLHDVGSVETWNFVCPGWSPFVGQDWAQIAADVWAGQMGAAAVDKW